MAEKRKKTQEVKVRLTKALHERLKRMAERRSIPIASLATFYVTRALENDEGEISKPDEKKGVASA